MKHFFFLVALVLTFSLQAQVSLKGSFTGLPDGTVVVINEVVGNKVVPRDTLTLDAKHHFQFQSELKEPSLYLLQTNINPQDVIHLMLLPKDKITLDLEYNAATRLTNINAVKGSDNIELYKQFRLLLASATSAETLFPQVESLLSNNSDKLMDAFLVTFFDEQFESYASLYKKIRDRLIKTYPNNSFVRYIDGKLRSTLVGQPAPEINMKDRDGNLRSLSSLKGNIVMIDFWASWCRPCRMENPNVVRLYHAYHDKGFEIYSVSMDKDRDAWLKAIADDGLVWPNHVSDLNGWTSSGGATYGISSIPATVLIDRDGTIIARNLRGKELENKLKELFNTPTDK